MVEISSSFVGKHQLCKSWWQQNDNYKDDDDDNTDDIGVYIVYFKLFHYWDRVSSWAKFSEYEYKLCVGL